MSRFVLKPVLQYGGAHFPFNPQGNDAAEITTPWAKSSPLCHASAAKPGADSSSLSESPVYLAIPKAVYGHNPCCHDPSCMMGHGYSTEHGQTAAEAEFEQHWTQGEAYRNQISPIKRETQDKLRGLLLDRDEEQVKRMKADNLSRGRPTRMEPNYSGYPCMPLSMLTSLSEQSRHLQASPRGYAGLPPSHTTYEHMTSELYQECSPMCKYGHPTKHPMFYYPRAHVEVENRARCRDVGGEQREDIPVIRNSPREHYTFPQMLHGDIPLFLCSTETQPNHSFVQGFSYPCYAHPGFHSGPFRNRERQHVPHGPPLHRISVSPSDQASHQRSNQHFGPLDTSHSLLRMDPISPTQPVGQSLLSPHIQINRMYPPPLTGRLDHQMDQAVFSPSVLTKDTLLDYSSFVGQVTSPTHPRDLSPSPRSQLLHSSKQTLDCQCEHLINRPKFETVIATSTKGKRLSCSCATSVVEQIANKPFPSLIKIKEEPPDLCETDLIRKQPKLEPEEAIGRNQEKSPQMPVIDNVFSLAPGHESLKPSGVLPPDIEDYKVKPTTLLKKIKPDPGGPSPYISSERPEVQMFEATTIKVEKSNQSETCDASENSPNPASCSTIEDQIKPQAEDATLSDTKSLLLPQICRPEKLECKASSLDLSDPSQSPKRPSSSSPDTITTPQKQESNIESRPLSPLKSNSDVKTNLHEWLKLKPTDNIHVPDRKLRHLASKQTPVQNQTEIPAVTPKPKVSVRKHFLELHRTLCKQVSICVCTTSEVKLRSWRSQLELVEASSTKVLNVSCLMGSKARHKWLNQEIGSALQEVLDRFQEYIVHERCPFPHVLRTGAVFLPMLVVKEILFPLVPGTFIDQVLQEHKVELRPTTLTEEKVLTQLHKPCSARLRRLMSLKHLPNVYADALNLFYYSSVCKKLDSTSADVQKTTQE